MRRFSQLSVEDLERRAASHPEDVADIIVELENHRTTRVAQHLLADLRAHQQGNPETTGSPQQRPSTDRTAGSSQGRSLPQQSQTRKRQRPSNWTNLFDYPATGEQEAAVDLFLSKQSMKISAFAGAGKTSTLKFLAATATNERGLYLAFNKSIAEEARESFNGPVDCRTTHSAALKEVRSRYNFSQNKWFNSINPKQLAAAWSIQNLKVGSTTLRPDMVAFLILQAVRRFCQSGDEAIGMQHVELLGRTLGLPEPRQQALQTHILTHAEKLWQQMIREDSDLPVGHDGYLKLWSLMAPKLGFDYVLLDEAQDTNPAVLSVLKNQNCQVIYVGDKHQQIYEWRGAVNAMAEIDASKEAFLTTSFRFGPALATEANRILAAMGETQTLKGFSNVQTEVLDFGSARTILTRTNASLFKEVLKALDAGMRPHVIGGTEQLKALLKDVDLLQAGSPGTQPEFFGFSSWAEVLEFIEQPEGEPLVAFVTLVQSVGRGALWHAVLSCEDKEENANVILSTAHKAKGREWDSVRIGEDFLSSRTQTNRVPFSEARLFYVAMTRAKRRLVVNPNLISTFSEFLCPDDQLATATFTPVEPSAAERPAAPSPRATAKPYHIERPYDTKTTREQASPAPQAPERRRRGFWSLFK